MTDRPLQMEIRHLRCFAAVATQLHFTRAAENLGISTPAISKQIQEIEQTLGTRLFERTKRSVKLTSAGHLYLAEVKQTLVQFARANETARRAGRGEVGRIEIGYVASAAFSGILQRNLSHFRRERPEVQINSWEVSMERLPKLLEEGDLDIAFLRPPMAYPSSIEELTLHRERFVLAVPADSQWAAGKTISASQLRVHSFVVPEQESGTMEVARRGKFSPKVAGRPGSLVAVLASVAMGQGVAVVPLTASEHIDVPGVRYCELAGDPVLSSIAMAYRQHERAPAVKAFLDQVREQTLVSGAAKRR
ncbi:LysR family transcriptional regulator [Variovorax sp. OK202]|uniref:LysR family transcriptional regulator n=1 Tax=Variovorax sp. OK202 TaxID=1884311 RepID=UPI0035273079